jgi:endonuclease/exonuclease/phosphatase family metal-dependent hydrolase
MPQVERILEVWGGEPQTIIGGDFNATPGTDEIASLRNAGLVSGQDAIGNAALNTFIAFDPFIRIDYVMGSPDVRFISSDVPRSLASDHLPVVVEIALPLTDR